jgi:hypothetical protein
VNQWAKVKRSRTRPRCRGPGGDLCQCPHWLTAIGGSGLDGRWSSMEPGLNSIESLFGSDSHPTYSWGVGFLPPFHRRVAREEPTRWPAASSL